MTRCSDTMVMSMVPYFLTSDLHHSHKTKWGKSGCAWYVKESTPHRSRNWGAGRKNSGNINCHSSGRHSNLCCHLSFLPHQLPNFQMHERSSLPNHVPNQDDVWGWPTPGSGPPGPTQHTAPNLSLGPSRIIPSMQPQSQHGRPGLT